MHRLNHVFEIPIGDADHFRSVGHDAGGGPGILAVLAGNGGDFGGRRRCLLERRGLFGGPLRQRLAGRSHLARSRRHLFRPLQEFACNLPQACHRRPDDRRGSERRGDAGRNQDEEQPSGDSGVTAGFLACALQELLGHIHIDSTRAYTKVDLAQLREVAENDADDY